MSSRLSRYAEGVMEAAWLAAVVIVPVFFNIYSSRIFEPDKITLLRTLALVTLAAWLIKLLEDGGPVWDGVPENGGGWRGRLQALLKIPLIAPAAALAGVYILSTIFSVTRYTSFWGSYQRLQGAYTLFSYLVIFAALVANLRRRAQVERLTATMILSSLPVSLYGILQRYHADPIPWGGDTAARIAANMGNSIFVAAYLILVFPLTAVRIVEAFDALMHERGHNGANFTRATLYIFILALQSVALYFSFSRGPWLGWGASLVVLWLGLAFIWRKRWMTITGVSLALIAGAFLATLNIPNGPLESLRSLPELGRLGQLFDAESRTGRVRTLIWQGAYELVTPHAPLEFPDGRQDSLNFLRPLIGYGPESMYVAYNRFYQPELTQVEKRNASPDRSHNETWDSLVITGILGLAVYLALFGSAIYYSLKWLGLIATDRQRKIFLGLYIGGGVISAIFFIAWRGPAYFGVALPFGMIFGVLVYFIAASLRARPQNDTSTAGQLRAYLLLGFLASVIAHFVEVNFGIAIAATRTYLFVHLALILLVGAILPRRGIYGAAEAAVEAERDDSPATGEPSPRLPARKKRAAARTAAARETPGRSLPDWLRQAGVAGLITALVLGTLGYLYISNASRSPSAAALIRESFTARAGSGSAVGIFALVLTSWIAVSLLLVSEFLEHTRYEKQHATSVWLKMLATAVGLSLAVAGVYWFWHADLLAVLNRTTATNIQMVLEQVQRSEGLLARYYGFALLLLGGLAIFLPENYPTLSFRSTAGFVVGAGAMLLAVFVAAATNLRVIQADVAFKTGDVFAQPNSWPVSIQIYNRARDLAPNEDYYYLFLGRSYLEYAKTLESSSDREQLIHQAEKDLLEAQRINPLNTDHTANLARLYSLWSGFSDDPIRQAERAEKADAYFAQAVRLSPQSARLLDEWAVHAMNNMNDPEAGFDFLQRSLEIDPYYDWTYGLLGDYLGRFAVAAPGLAPEKKTEILVQASDFYTKAVALADPADVANGYGYLISYGSTVAQLGNIDAAIQAYLRALGLWPENPERWRVEAAVAQLYAQAGEPETALEYARKALETVPDDQRSVIEDLIQQYGG